MEKDKIYKIYINDDLYFSVTYNGEDVVVVPGGGNIDFEEELLRITTTDKKAYIKVADIPKCIIDLKTGKVNTNKTIIPTAAVRNFLELVLPKPAKNPAPYFENYDRYLETNSETIIEPKTDLHTHFMEVLTGEEFLKIVLRHIDVIGIDSEGNLCSAYPRRTDSPRELDYDNITWYKKEEILSNAKIYNYIVKQLSIYADTQVAFNEINKVLTRRTALLDLIGYLENKRTIEDLEVPVNQLENTIRKIISDAKAELYFEMLIRCLEVLKRQGVKYVELSYSTHTTIMKMVKRMKDIHIEGIDYNFLLSENRNAPGINFREYSINPKTKEKKRNRNAVEVNLRNMIKEGFVKGFDLMGLEDIITKHDYEKESIGYTSLYDKLEPIIKVLNSFNDDTLVCRLHAGEIKYDHQFDDRSSNPLKILEILDKIVEDNKLKVPPPTIRLGHGLHIDKNERYLELLRKYKVIIEINASSNFALSNIKNMKDIPYRWYCENNIPLILGTDGGGFYLTRPADEAKIAELFGDEKVLENVENTENEELKRRGK